MKLRELRKLRDLTQKQLADMLNFKNTTYSNWECGIAEPDISSLKKLADFFDCSVDYLIGREDEDGIIVRESGVTLSLEEEKLLENYRGLSKTGQAKVNGYIEGLKSAPEYKNTTAYGGNLA